MSTNSDSSKNPMTTSTRKEDKSCNIIQMMMRFSLSFPFSETVFFLSFVNEGMRVICEAIRMMTMNDHLVFSIDHLRFHTVFFALGIFSRSLVVDFLHFGLYVCGKDDVMRRCHQMTK